MRPKWTLLIPLLLAVSLLILLTSAMTASAQVGLPPLTPYAQNFDTLANSGTSSTLPTGWFLSEAGTNADGMYAAGTGSSNAGNTYSFGATANTERALGGLQSATLSPTIGAGFINNTGGTIGQLAISYNCEEWRLGTVGRTDQLDFQYSTDATSLTTGTWIDFNTLDCLTTDSTGIVGLRDGNTIRTFRSGAITGLSVPNGSTFWLRWLDFDASGSDDGLGIDDFSMNLFTPTAVTLNAFTANAAPFPIAAALAVLGLIAVTSGLVAARRRKQNTNQ